MQIIVDGKPIDSGSGGGGGDGGGETPSDKLEVKDQDGNVWQVRIDNEGQLRVVGPE